MSIKTVVPFTLALMSLASEAIPADAQNARSAQPSQRIMRTLLPVKKILPRSIRTIVSRLPNPGGMRNGLPPTNLDSFVYESGGKAWHIYGDEGVYSIPPFMEFTEEHRIEAGINGRRRRGLTTGHGSYLPDAWGGDEFVDGPEWSNSGAGGTRSAFQRIEAAVQNTAIGMIGRTPPFGGDQMPTGPNIKQSPNSSPANELESTMTDTANNFSQSNQALFGRQLGQIISPSESPAFSWP